MPVRARDAVINDNEPGSMRKFGLDGESIEAQCSNGLVTELTPKYTNVGLHQLEFTCSDGSTHRLAESTDAVEGEMEVKLTCETSIKEISIIANVNDATLLKGLKVTCSDDSEQEWIVGSDAEQDAYSTYRSLCTYNYEFVGFYGRYLDGIVRMGQKCGSWAP